MTLKAMACAAGVLAGLLSGAPAIAQTYPTKTVKIIVPYQAGQGTDVAARYFAEQLSKSLGQTFYVDNKPGAGGNIGAEATAHAPPDGYTLMMGTNATQR
jgi:tripartite-type tricarboxylate transporter receptor subunit TctC